MTYQIETDTERLERLARNKFTSLADARRAIGKRYHNF